MSNTSFPYTPLLATMTSETMVPKELTIIVAATARNMGIGRAGELPWTSLRKEMAYFARVTKRVPLAATPNPEVVWALSPKLFGDC